MHVCNPLIGGDFFEDPLGEALKIAGLGEVTGGGTQLADEPAGIEFCDIEIEIKSANKETLNFIIQTLENLGAPKGSRLVFGGLRFFGEGKHIPFGKLEGLGLFLNGTNLPDKVYEQGDVNKVIEQCNNLMKGIGKQRGHWEGNKETAIYFYGKSYIAMKEVLDDFVKSDPLCEKARFEQIA